MKKELRKIHHEQHNISITHNTPKRAEVPDPIRVPPPLPPHEHSHSLHKPSTSEFLPGHRLNCETLYIPIYVPTGLSERKNGSVLHVCRKSIFIFIFITYRLFHFVWGGRDEREAELRSSKKKIINGHLAL
jgi:hypothetical protein